MDSLPLKRTKRPQSALPLKLSAPPRQSAPPQQRFAAPVTSKTFRKVLCQRTPRKNNHWALNNFYSRLQQRSKQQPEDPCPTDILLTKEPELLNKWLSLFVLETRKLDASEYPPKTLHQILCGIQRYMRENAEEPFNIFDKNDHRFRGFRGTCDREFQRLHQNGVGADVKHAEIITSEEEETLWSAGVLGVSSPKAFASCHFLPEWQELLLARRTGAQRSEVVPICERS